MQTLDLLGHWHERASINIKRHLEDVSETELPAGATAEAINLTTLRQHHRVDISTGCVRKFQQFERLYNHSSD